MTTNTIVVLLLTLIGFAAGFIIGAELSRKHVTDSIMELLEGIMNGES